MRVLFFSASLPPLVISGLFDNNHSDRYEKLLFAVLICISLMISDVEHLFIYLLTICIFSGKCLFSFSDYFLIGMLFFFDMELYEFFIYNLDIDPLSFANIFSYSVACLFVLLKVSFTVQNFLILLMSHLLNFLFSKETDPKICS